ELPNVPEDYVHRIGRTGRAGNTGEAISLVCVDEYRLLKDIERVLKREVPKEIIAGYEPDPRIKAEPIQNGRGSRGSGPRKSGGYQGAGKRGVGGQPGSADNRNRSHQGNRRTPATATRRG